MLYSCYIYSFFIFCLLYLSCWWCSNFLGAVFCWAVNFRAVIFFGWLVFLLDAVFYGVMVFGGFWVWVVFWVWFLLVS